MYKVQDFQFVFTGVDLKSAPDALPPGKLRRALNVRPAIEYGLIPRQGTNTLTPAPLADNNVHTIRYLNDPVVGPSLLWGGAGPDLYNLQTGALLVTGFSGNPLTDVPYRLNGTSQPYDIIADSRKMIKMASNGNVYQLGITPPSVAATSTVQAVETTDIDTFPADTGYTYSAVGSHSLVATGGYNPNSLQIVTSGGSPGFSSLSHDETVDLNLVGPFDSLPTDVITMLVNVSSIPDVSAIELQIMTGSSGDYFITILEAPGLAAGAFSTVTFPKSSFFGTTNADWSNVTSYTLSFYISTSSAITIQVNALYLAGGAGPNSSVGVGYDWRYTYRNLLTLSESNPSPVQAALSYAVLQGVELGPTASTDAQVNQIRWWRRGGVLSDAWRLVGVQSNQTSIAVSTISWATGVATVTTTNPHGFQSGQGALIAGSSASGYDGSFQITVLTPLQFSYALASNPGSVGTGGTAQFLDIDSDQAIASAAELSLFNDVPVTTINVAGQTVYGQPLAFIWGPYSGTTIFGCGDPNQPGFLYWCNPSNPDGWSSLNNVEVTQPSDPLQNGFFWNGAAYVFSKEKLFQLQPTPVGGSLLTYFPVDMVIGTGLYAPWAIAASPHTPAVWFVGKDGVYEWTGGAATLISDDLWPIFHQATVEGNYPIDLSNPEKIKLAFFDGELRLNFFDINGGNQIWICDILHGHRWRQASYLQSVVINPGPPPVIQLQPLPITEIYAQPEVTNILLMGTTTGIVLQESEAAFSDTGTAISCDIRTQSWNGGETRNQKVFGDIGVDFDAQGISVAIGVGYNYFNSTLPGNSFSQVGRTTQQVDINNGSGQLAFTIAVDISWQAAGVTPTVYGWSPSYVIKPEDTILRFTDPEDAGSFGAKHIRGIILEADTSNQPRQIQIQGDSGPAGLFENQNSPITVQHNGQSEIAYPFVPFQAHNLRLAPLDSNPWRLFRWRWIFDEYPENIAIYGAWTNDGYAGAKFVQGCVLEADTMNQPVVLQVQGDGAAVFETFTAIHNGRSEIAYPRATGAWTPFITHNLRIVPQAPIRIFSVRWIWTPSPEAATRWQTPATTNGLRGYQSAYIGYIAHISDTNISVQVIPDIGPEFTITVNMSNGVFAKNLIQFPPNKFKSCQWIVTSPSPVQIFLAQLEIRMRSWDGDDIIVKPFGDVAQEPTARI